tara:strand:+ start:146 stop:1036 length:891 start_codon:yes stop_codon:yes gene_type:complete
MIENGKENVQSFHLAGIVPVAGQKLDFNFPWHDSLIPVAKDFLAVERSVYECSLAGCETIWIVCHKDMQPLIRYRIGEWIEDIAKVGRADKFPSESRRRIPIYYVPIHPKDRDKRDCLGWSVLYGALTAYSISKRMSKWVVPDRYYVSFPYGVYDMSNLRKNRKKISNRNNFYACYNGKTVQDGEYLSFTFSGEDFKRIRRKFRENSTNSFVKGTLEKLPIEERYNSRYFSLDKIFKYVIIETDDLVVDVDWYYNIDNWDGYCSYLGSEESKYIFKPNYIKYHEWNPIGYEEEDNE